VEDGASEASVEVSDDGPGLTEDQARHIFERFYRVDPSRSRASGGSGLGLSIAWSIVNALGGTLTAAPRPGGGASFVVRLPHLSELDGRASDAPDAADGPDVDRSAPESGGSPPGAPPTPVGA
jgi:two-component system OmpR family sensor kinase